MGFLKDGKLTITGRKKDVIIVNGLNYYSHEIESAVEELDGISASFTAACPIRTADSNTDQLAVFFHSNQTEEADVLALLKSVREQVVHRIGINPSYLIPIEPDAIPKTAIGKIQRSKLGKELMAGAFDDIIKQVDILTVSPNTMPDWFYQKYWYRKQGLSSQVFVPQGSILILQDGLGLGASLCQSLQQQGQSYIQVEVGKSFRQVNDRHYTLTPDSIEDYHQLCQSLAAQNLNVGAIVHLWHYSEYGGEIDHPEALEATQNTGIYSLLGLVQAITASQLDTIPVRLLYVASHSQSVQSTDAIAYAKATVPGLLKTIPKEHLHWDCRHLDLPLDALAVNGDRITHELALAAKDLEVAYRDQQRWVAGIKRCDFTQLAQQEVPFKAGGTYVLSGGLGGIGTEIARYLLKQYQARLLLLGRTALPEQEDWETHLQQGDRVAEKIDAYQQLQALGGEVIYRAVDICDRTQVEATVEQTVSQWGTQLDGVIHLAGTVHQQLLSAETPDSVGAVLGPKVTGGWVLHQLLRGQPDCLFINFSSVAACFGVPMLGAYAAANSFLSGLTDSQRYHGGQYRYCFYWAMWSDLGMGRDQQMQSLTYAQNQIELDVTRGLQAFTAGLSHSQSQIIVGLDGNHANIRRFTTQSNALQQLTAFFTTKDNNKIDVKRGRHNVCDRLGTPSQCAFVELEHLPLTETGEIDRDQLAQSTVRQIAINRVKPRTDLERQIAQTWQDVLGITQLSVDDNFFALGGNSLLATQVISRLQENCSSDITLQGLFESPTIETIAQHMEMLHRFAQDETTSMTELEEDYEDVL